MFISRTFLMLSVAFILGGCAVAPKIHLKDSNMAMEVKVNIPFVASIDYSPDGKSFASGHLDGSLRLWEIESGKLTKRIMVSSTGFVNDVKYSGDGKTLVTGNYIGETGHSDGFVRFWDVKSGAQTKQLSGYKGAVMHGVGMTFSADGKRLLYQSESDVMRLIDTQSGRKLRDFSGYRGGVSPDGRHVFTTAIIHGLFVSSSSKLFDSDTGQEIWSLSKKEWSGNQFKMFSHDGKYILILSNDKSFPVRNIALRLIDVSTGKEVRRFEAQSEWMTGGSFSQDGKTFISSFRTGSGIIGDRMDFITWDSQSGAVVKRFSMGDLESTMSNPVAPAFSPDNKFAIATAGSSVKLMDTSTGDELATMIGFEDGEWLVTTPSGYYNASEKGDQYLNVTVGGKPYTISQLRESFYRPDLVKLALSGSSMSEFRKIADIKPPPAVAIIDTPATSSADQITVSLEVKDQGGGIGDVRLYRNGTAVVLEKTRNLQAVSTAQGGQVLRYTLKLEAGKNAIRAIAFNADNSMQSANATMEIQASFSSRPPGLYALVVGIKDYVNPRLALTYPVADAELFAATLESKGKGLFDSVEVHRLLKPEETTSAAITAALRQAQKDVKPEDLFVFYVASHGTVDDGQYLLVTSNVGSTSTARLKQDALTQDILKEMISNIPASKKLVVLDTCNAGKMGDALQMAMLTRGMSEDTAMKVLSRAVGSTILSAASSVQEALEGYKGHGLFTWVVVEGLKGAADADKDGFVKTLELADYVDNQVPELAERVFNHKQFPIVSPTGQGFPLVRVR